MGSESSLGRFSSHDWVLHLPTPLPSAHLASWCLLQALLCFVHKVLLFKVQIAFKFDQSLKQQETITSELEIYHRMANLLPCLGKGEPDGWQWPRVIHLIFVSVRQRSGSLSIFWKADVKPQNVPLSVARWIMLPYGLVKLCSLFAAPGVTEFVISQRCLEVPCRNQCFLMNIQSIEYPECVPSGAGLMVTYSY